MNIISKLQILSLFCLSMTCGASTDWKTYPGTMCVPGLNHEIADYDAFGVICNMSVDQNLVVHRSIVRDMAKGSGIEMVRHAGRSGNQDQPLVCRLRNMMREAGDGGFAMQHLVDELNPIYADGKKIQYVESFKYMESSSDFGSTVLTCDLPPSNTFGASAREPVFSCLYNYSIKECDEKQQGIFYVPFCDN